MSDLELLCRALGVDRNAPGADVMELRLQDRQFV